MHASPDESRTPLEAFLAAFRTDIEADAVRPLAEYLTRFPGNDDGIAEAYLAERRGGSPGPSADRIAHYRIVRQIGRGGQATVYLAEDTVLGRKVALKVLETGLTTNPEAIARFRREAEITSKLDNPGICPIYATGEDRGSFWIAMRYVEGDSLAKKISTAREGEASSTTTFVVESERAGRENATPGRPGTNSSGPKTWTEIARILALFEEAARTLHVAHEAGVIHRDIKPGNLIVTKDGNPVILDFGLAQDVVGEQATLTLTGDIMGTPAYMSPEQIAAQRIRLDRRTDVYSLGVSLYECLTLHRPFDAPTREGLYQAIMTKEPPDLRRLNPAIPEDLRVVAATAIEKDRDRRYQTALDLAEELRRVRMHEPIVAKPVGPLVRLQRWAQRNPALAAAVAGILGALAIGLALTLSLLWARNQALAAVTAERDAKNVALNEKAAALSDYERLGDLERFDALVDAEAQLWPAHPSRVDDMKRFLEEATTLAARLDGHMATLERLRDDSLARAPSDDDVSMRAHYKEQLRARSFKERTTRLLVDRLSTMINPDPSRGLIAHMQARLNFAESVERETIGKYKAEWANAIRSIADKNDCPQYGGLKIKQQLGLIPIGKDPASGLWEFAHLQTTAPGTEPIPKRGADGRLVVTESMGLVFVLLPGGTLRMGAIRPNRDQSATDPNIDPDAAGIESPITDVPLGPFFMSKYEMTQGQWERVVGMKPSMSAKRHDDLRNPVEEVSWNDCDVWLGRLGLILPTEAQWEYAARGGTTTPRWTGVGTEGLVKAANIADAFLQERGGLRTWNYEPWNDGYVLAPVGSFAANPFGLHDVLGNVWEWCRGLGLYGNQSPGAGEEELSMYRGGGWHSDAASARSALRGYSKPGNRDNDIGVRPAKVLDR